MAKEVLVRMVGKAPEVVDGTRFEVVDGHLKVYPETPLSTAVFVAAPGTWVSAMVREYEDVPDEG